MKSGNVALKSRMAGNFSLRPSQFHRPKFMMGNPGQKEEKFGLAVLTALSIAGLHSAVCPSYFTMVTFGSQPEAKSRAMDGLWISLGLSTVASIAIYGVWKDLSAAIVGQATALALFGIGVYAISKDAPKSIPPIEQQGNNPAGIQRSTEGILNA
jgi:hypothetical protein